MKRAHRRNHFLIWLLLGPAMFAIIILAVLNRPDAPMNDSLPDSLTQEAR
ncbi:MAG: hypothetical protein AAF269_14710 [Pseudomonadota bacterium]